MCKDLPALLYNYKPFDSLYQITLPDYDEDTKAFDTYKMMNKTRDSILALENGNSDLANNTRDLLHKQDKTVLPTPSPQNKGLQYPIRRIRYVPYPLPDTRNTTHRNKRNKRFISTFISLA